MNLPFRRRWIAFAIIAVWIVGFVFQSPHDGDVNPIQASKPRYIAEDDLELVLTADGPMDMIGCLRNCWFAGSSASQLVLFEDTRMDHEQYYYGLLGQYGQKWHRTDEGSLSLDDSLNDNRVFSIVARRYQEGHSWMYRWGIVQDYIVAFGKVDPAQVARVDLVHDTGEISSVWPTGEYFVNFAAASIVCEAHAVDYQGEVVESLEAGYWPGVINTGPGTLNPTCD